MFTSYYTFNSPSHCVHYVKIMFYAGSIHVPLYPIRTDQLYLLYLVLFLLLHRDCCCHKQLAGNADIATHDSCLIGLIKTRYRFIVQDNPDYLDVVENKIKG